MTDHPDLPPGSEALVEHLLFSGVLDQVHAEHEARLSADSEWTTPRPVHQTTLLRCFVHGILTADPWHQGYRLPPHFEGVVNMIAFEIQRAWPTEVPTVSLLEFEHFLRRTCPLHPEFKKWNETTELVGIVSRYTPMATARDFIDLDALYRNAALALRDDHRRNDAFDARFAAQHPEAAADLAKRTAL